MLESERAAEKRETRHVMGARVGENAESAIGRVALVGVGGRVGEGRHGGVDDVMSDDCD